MHTASHNLQEKETTVESNVASAKELCTEIQTLINDSFEDARKTDEGMKTPGRRLRKRMGQIMDHCTEIRKIVILKRQGQ